MLEPRIIFSGGGDEMDTRPLDEMFAAWVPPKGRILFLPIAMMQREAMEDSVRWFTRAYAPLGITHFDAWLDLSGKTARDLAPYDALYISGGNTFYLLDQVRRNGLASILSDFIQAGHPAYGGSAGAILLSHDITPSAHIDPDVVGLADLSALDLALGYSIWCHYQTSDDERIRGYIARTGVPSIAISERSGVRREGPNLFAAGYEPARVFSAGEDHWVESGDQIL